MQSNGHQPPDSICLHVATLPPRQHGPGFYGIPAPAPLCADGSDTPGDQVLCQVLEAPESARRLVPDASFGPSSRDGEIRLTYGQLTALIADAVRTLKDP